MARHDDQPRMMKQSNDDAFLDLFNDKDVTFDDMADAMSEEGGRSASEQQKSTRNVQSGISQEMLGIDEEVKIKKVRRPVVKLDEGRLTSAAGISKLQTIAKTKMKFRGKGHEFSDVALLLRTYQLWLHDLYPRAKFKDGLIMLEKLGHTKSVQRLRCEWIDQSKPGANEKHDSEDDHNDEVVDVTDKANDSLQHQKNYETDSDDRGTEGSAGQNSTSAVDIVNAVVDIGQPDEDELDALLAEEQEQTIQRLNQTTSQPVHRSHTNPTRPDQSQDDFGRDEDIMRELEMWDD